MRRPAQTREQKKHAREQRALLTLRRSAVRYSMLGDDQEGSPPGRFATFLEDRERPLAPDEYKLLCEAIELVVRRAYIHGAKAAHEGVR